VALEKALEADFAIHCILPHAVAAEEIASVAVAAFLVEVPLLLAEELILPCS
jgi:hypothetical protein